MDWIKRNMVLSVVVALTLLVSAVLLFLTIAKYNEVTRQLDEVETLREQIHKLNDESPAPLDENLKRIKADSEQFSKRVERVEMVFGRPYRKALQAFATTVFPGSGREEAERIVIDKLRDFWRRGYSPHDATSVTVTNFLSELDAATKDAAPPVAGGLAPGLPGGAATTNENAAANEDADAVPAPAVEAIPSRPVSELAMEAFAKTAQQTTVELISSHNVNDILLRALGVPRMMSGNECKTVIVRYHERLSEKLQRIAQGRVRELTFGEYLGATMPHTENIPFILMHLTMIEDLAARVLASGVDGWEAVERVSGLRGEDKRGFLYFRYNIKVIGELDQIRSLLSLLQDAHKDNHVYVVTELGLEKVEDAAKRISSGEAAGTATRTPAGARASARSGGAVPEVGPTSQDDDFGRPIIGVNNRIRATIEFDYIVYAADDLAR